MKKTAALLLIGLAVTVGPLAAQAHGPGAGLLYNHCGTSPPGSTGTCPWAGIVHTHCTTAANANEFYVSAGGQNVGIGKHSQNPTVVDWYVIAPVVGSGPTAGNNNPCFDSQVP